MVEVTRYGTVNERANVLRVLGTRVTTVFIGGSRRLSRLGAGIQRRLDSIVEKGFAVIVGDANGADEAVQL